MLIDQVRKTISIFEQALSSMHVHREAYYGGTFTGNHAHKCSKIVYIIHYTILTNQAVNIDSLTRAIVHVASTQLEDRAQEFAIKHGKPLLLYHL